MLISLISCLRRASSQELSAANALRTDYATRIMGVAIASWVVLVFAVIVFGRANTIKNSGDLFLANILCTSFHFLPRFPVTFPMVNIADSLFIAIFGAILDHSSEFVIGLCVLSLVDRRGGIARIVQWLLHGTTFDATNQATTRSTEDMGDTFASSPSTRASMNTAIHSLELQGTDDDEGSSTSYSKDSPSLQKTESTSERQTDET